MNRRDFNKLGMAALGGMLSGAAIARADDKKSSDSGSASGPKDPKKSLWLQEPHICRGINTCKGKGKGGKNDCAGQGSCFTTNEHTCSGKNVCRGLGGCGANPGDNDCKGKGDCGIPLSDDAWKKARKRFEAEMKKADKKFGDAPKKGS
jgi:hypothetical protein